MFNKREKWSGFRAASELYDDAEQKKLILARMKDDYRFIRDSLADMNEYVGDTFDAGLNGTAQGYVYVLEDMLERINNFQFHINNIYYARRNGK